MNISDEKIAEILVKGSYLEKSDIDNAYKNIGANNENLVSALLNLGLLNKDLLGQAIAEYFNVSYSDLNSFIPDRDQVLLIPEEIAKKFNVVIFREDKNEIIISTDNPSAKDLVEELKKIFGNKEIKITYSLEEDILNTFVYYRKPLDTRFTDLLKKDSGAAPQIVEEIFRDALIYKATDIHFEPEIDEVVIRFRVDGLMYEAGRLQKKYYGNIINRIKVLSSLKIDEHYKPQDGAIRFKIDNRNIDLRISIIPTIEGEKIVIRVLAEYVKSFSLTDIGLSERDKNIVLKSINKPVGMIIIAGPTGSGKTTTLYSFLRTLNNPSVNITTIEDPVEYRISGINQIQVDRINEVTFANGLRSVVRQDPDIILVGEIRDKETAELSVNAALTGHLLLSTFHANDSATVIPRLIDMGAEPFLLASTIELVVSQRLVRKLCENCRHSETLTREKFIKQVKDGEKFIGPRKSINIYEGKGCPSCNGTGYKGRTSIYEIIQMTRELKELILNNPSSIEIWKTARAQGVRSMFEDGVEKVLQGVTSIEELKRVAPPDEF
jgi:type II secretory ATPase GspE/PulE/Tfp pilus assembly ATPase PilB-like protein